MKIIAHYEDIYICSVFLTAIVIVYIAVSYPNNLSIIEKYAAALICFIFITSNVIKLYKIWKTK